MLDIKKYKIDSRAKIREAVKRIDEGGIGFGIVVDRKSNALGVITDGDFRRAVLDGINLDENVLKITNTDFNYLEADFKESDARTLLQNKRIEYLPVLRNKKPVGIISKEYLSADKNISHPRKKVNASVVIMAGGKGTRMEPFTKILPKPLIPIREKAMIEIIMEEYAKFGMNNFYVSVFHKANMIKSYFEYLECDYKIKYLHEDRPLGTAGALKYLKGKMKASFFVSNCDIIIKDDYKKIFEYHKSGKYALTMVTAMQQVKIPYGVCELTEDRNLKKIVEKPELDYMINTGMYVLSPKALELIPDNKYFNITDLIHELINNKFRVGVYPVSEKSYVDVGQWAEYKKAINVLTL